MDLLDTNVVSELGKAKTSKANKHVLSWAAATPDSTFFLSSITVLKSDSDSLIAATAIVHGMTIVMHNIRDFDFDDLEVINPWN